jgi:hypothetical protein
MGKASRDVRDLSRRENADRGTFNRFLANSRKLYVESYGRKGHVPASGGFTK